MGTGRRCNTNTGAKAVLDRCGRLQKQNRGRQREKNREREREKWMAALAATMHESVDSAHAFTISLASSLASSLS